jgi:hypothetical protein
MPTSANVGAGRPTVFVSYSRQDKRWKNRLVQQLKVLEPEGVLEVWDDQQISLGGDWQSEIEQAMERAAVAVLLISAASLTSEFILGQEVPRLLERRRAGLLVVPLLVSPCDWKGVPWLASISWRPRDGRSLSGVSKTKADECLAALVGEIRQHLAPGEAQRSRQLLTEPERILLSKVRSAVEHDPKPVVPIQLAHEENVLALPFRPLEGVRPEAEQRSVIDVFLNGQEEGERNLLICGGPGSGKSRTLRQLALDLADRAEGNPQARRIPVLFDLTESQATWSEHSGGLKDWLIEQLGSPSGSYKMIASAKEWIDADRVIPLLDGLDELSRERRSACVDAIEKSLRGDLGMVVCCENATELPEFDVKIVLQPLREDQIEGSLADAGACGEPVGKLLAEEAEFRDLAKTPLLLDFLLKTFRDTPPEAHAETAAGLKGTGEGSWRICYGYAKAMLRENRKKETGKEETRQEETARYSPEETRSALEWLARGMKEGFRIEKLQPCWLQGQAERLAHAVLAYAVLSRVVVGCLLVLPLTLGGAPGFWLGLGVLAGALVGATDARSLRDGEPGSRRVESPGLGQAVARTVLIGGEALLAGLLLGWLWLRADPRRLDSVPLGLAAVILCALLFGLVFGLRGAGRDGGSDIEVGPKLEARWSWPEACRGAAWVGGVTLLAFVAQRVAVAFGAADTLLGVRVGLFILAVLALAGGVAGGLLYGLKPVDLNTEVRPNHGIWLALYNAVLIGFLVLFVTMAGLAGLVWALEKARQRIDPEAESLAAFYWVLPVVGLTLALWVGLWKGGMDFLKHFTLRLFLALRTPLPANCDRFLRHATRQGLLNEKNGSYKFDHELLRRYFAGQKKQPGA